MITIKLQYAAYTKHPRDAMRRMRVLDAYLTYVGFTWVNPRETGLGEYIRMLGRA